jgi:hypothetical protein
MFAIWIYSLPLLLLAGFAYWLLRNSATWLRVSVTAIIWPALPVALTLWVVIVGDQMPPNAVLVDPETLEERPIEPQP